MRERVKKYEPGEHAVNMGLKRTPSRVGRSSDLLRRLRPKRQCSEYADICIGKYIHTVTHA